MAWSCAEGAKALTVRAVVERRQASVPRRARAALTDGLRRLRRLVCVARRLMHTSVGVPLPFFFPFVARMERSVIRGQRYSCNADPGFRFTPSGLRSLANLGRERVARMLLFARHASSNEAGRRKRCHDQTNKCDAKCHRICGAVRRREGGAAAALLQCLQVLAAVPVAAMPQGANLQRQRRGLPQAPRAGNTAGHPVAGAAADPPGNAGGRGTRRTDGARVSAGCPDLVA